MIAESKERAKKVLSPKNVQAGSGIILLGCSLRFFQQRMIEAFQSEFKADNDIIEQIVHKKLEVASSDQSGVMAVLDKISYKQAAVARRKDQAMPTGTHSTSWLARRRWNIVDLVTVFGKAAIPLYLISDIDMSWAENLRAKLNEGEHQITVTAILLKAIALAQKDHPLSRGVMLPWGSISIFKDIVAGFTVERMIGGQPAVFLGTIDHPDTKTIEQIAQELKTYATKELSQVPQLDREDRFSRMPWLVRRVFLILCIIFPSLRLKYLGATFGLSSLGKFSVQTAMGPCTCTSTFGIGCVEKRATVHNAMVAVRPMMTMTLGVDSRVMNAASAAQFLQDVQQLIELGFSNRPQTIDSSIVAVAPKPQ